MKILSKLLTIMYSLQFTRKSVVCLSNNETNSRFTEKTKKVFVDFHKKRSDTFKKNVGELTKVSQVEITELNDFLKELDVFHKEQFEDLKKSFNKQSENTPIVPEVVEVRDENIFLDK